MTNEMHEAWHQATEYLENVLPQGDYDTWVKPVVYSHHDNSAVFLSVPNTLIKNWLDNHYMKTIMTGALSKASGHIVTINVIVGEVKELPASRDTYHSTFSLLNPKYTFELFVQGTGNQLAYNAATIFAIKPDDACNPLYIYAGAGLGKSHLLNAIGHTIQTTMPDKVICYCTAEKFMYEFVHHLRHKKMDQFRNYFHNVDVLLMDDIQFMLGRSGTQEEFLLAFNALHEASKHIVITSDRPIKELDFTDKRLASRLSCGLITEIYPPDYETKVAMIIKKVETLNMAIPEDVINFLASSDTNDIRELEGMLNKLVAYSSMQGVPIDMNMAKNNL